MEVQLMYASQSGLKQIRNDVLITIPLKPNGDD